MRRALRLANRAAGETSPNPMVGAILTLQGKIIGQGWHRRAGGPHAEIEALNDARKRGHNTAGATLYVTLEPCSTHGRTPPCTNAIVAAGVKRVVVAATDPNPQHCGKGLRILERAGIEVISGVEQQKAARLNEVFNHWIVHRTPFVTVKAAMTMDGKIATATGESKWITGPESRACGMKLRQGSDAIVVGVNTVMADDPKLTIRGPVSRRAEEKPKALRRLVLDPSGKVPLSAALLCDDLAHLTSIIVTDAAPKKRTASLANKVQVIVAPQLKGRIHLRWLMKKLGAEGVTSLLVEGGGETNALFFEQGLAHRVAFFYAPKILGGHDARKGVAGIGAQRADEKITLRDVEWKKIGEDLLLTGLVSLP